MFYGNYDVLSHVMCNLGNTENNTDKYLNIIEYYEIERKLFTAKYIFISDKVIENTV